jgi:hypothetical protein
MSHREEQELEDAREAYYLRCQDGIDEELEAQNMLDDFYDRQAQLVYETIGEDLNGMDEVDYRQAIRYTKDVYQDRLIAVLRQRRYDLMVPTRRVTPKPDGEPTYLPFTFGCMFCKRTKAWLDGEVFVADRVETFWIEGRKMRTTKQSRKSGNMIIFCKECHDSDNGQGVLHGVDKNGCPFMAIMSNDKED